MRRMLERLRGLASWAPVVGLVPRPRPAREGSKKAIVLELIRRADGASLKEIADATQWQAHSVRGFISGSLGKKMGLTVESFKRADGERAYRTAAK